MFSDLSEKLKMKSTDDVGRICMRENDGKLYLNEKDRAKLKNSHM